MIALIAPILLFISFLILLLVSLSLPIIKTIYLFRLTADVTESVTGANARGDATFGVWGYCTGTATLSAFGFDASQAGECTKPHLGYTFDNVVAQALGVDDDFDAINKALTAVLVLHPIVCALTFVTLVVSLFILRRGTNGLSARLPSLITLGFGVITAILTTVVFLVDVIFVAVVRSSVHRLSEGNLTLVWGNAVWMTLGATISTWLAICGACGGVVIGRRRSRTANTQKF
jgi:hypothetical protein